MIAGSLSADRDLRGVAQRTDMGIDAAHLLLCTDRKSRPPTEDRVAKGSATPVTGTHTEKR